LLRLVEKGGISDGYRDAPVLHNASGGEFWDDELAVPWLAAMMRALRAIVIAAIALTIAAPALPALASTSHGLKKVYA
jgi:hypothetical protein